jgi:hypothetical protein
LSKDRLGVRKIFDLSIRDDHGTDCLTEGFATDDETYEKGPHGEEGM